MNLVSKGKCYTGQVTHMELYVEPLHWVMSVGSHEGNPTPQRVRGVLRMVILEKFCQLLQEAAVEGVVGSLPRSSWVHI